MATGFQNLLTLLEANKCSLGTLGMGDDYQLLPWILLCALPVSPASVLQVPAGAEHTDTPNSMTSRTHNGAFLPKPHAHTLLPVNWLKHLSSMCILLSLVTKRLDWHLPVCSAQRKLHEMLQCKKNPMTKDIGEIQLAISPSWGFVMLISRVNT